MKINKKFKFRYLFLLFLVFCVPFGFLQAGNCSSVGISNMGIDLLSDPTGRSCPDLTSPEDLAGALGKKVNVIVKVIFGFSATIGLIAFVYAGVVILTSKGNPDAFKNGMNIIKFTFLGIVIMIFSYAIVNFFTTTIPKITRSNGIQYVENGDFCGGNTKESALGTCYYLLQDYIKSDDYLADWNINKSAVCGIDANFTKTENGIVYSLRCVKKEQDIPDEKIYSPINNANKKQIQ